MREAKMSKACGMAVLALSMLAACRRTDGENGPQPASTPMAASGASTVPIAPDPFTVILTKKTVAQALAVATPFMTDTKNVSSRGTELFVLWATTNLKWTDVDVDSMGV